MLTVLAATGARDYDVVRVVALVLGSMSVAVAAVIGVTYFALYFRHRAAQRAGIAPSWRGLLPRHVGLIALSYILLALGTMYEITLRLHEAPSWRSPVYCLAYITGLWAMWDVLGHQRYRARDLNQREKARTSAPEQPTAGTPDE